MNIFSKKSSVTYAWGHSSNQAAKQIKIITIIKVRLTPAAICPQTGLYLPEVPPDWIR